MKKSHSLEILFEDQWVIVVHKPSGLLSVGYPGSRGRNAQEILSDMNRRRGRHHIAVIHRLDRDTSGVMMFACTAESKETFMKDWQSIVTERTYRCVCARAPGARPLPDEGECDAPIAYNKYDVGFVPRTGDLKAQKEAEKAVTKFRVIARGARCDLVECELETGRKNQIRIHLAHQGHPVAGDGVYGTAGEDGSGKPIMDGPDGRLGLHARVLAFTHPFTGEQLRFEAPEPASFEKLVHAGTEPKKTPGAGTRPTGSPGTKPATKRQAQSSPARTARRADRREPDIEDLTDLKPVARRSRTKQERGKSRFIPPKRGPGR